jgi:hypothetical protein
MIVFVIDKPASVCAPGTDIYIGPTAIDLSPIAEHDARLERDQRIRDQIRESEAQELRNARSGRAALRSRWQKPHAQDFH